MKVVVLLAAVLFSAAGVAVQGQTYGGYAPPPSYGGYGGYPPPSYGSYPPPSVVPPPPTYSPPPLVVDPCYDFTSLGLASSLNLEPCGDQLPIQICRGDTEFQEGGFLHQFWFVLANGTNRGFAKTNHGTFRTYPTSWVATSDIGWNITTQQIICRLLKNSDVVLDLQSSPPSVTLTETCEIGGRPEIRITRHTFASAVPPHCTPQLIPQLPERVVRAWAEDGHIMAADTTNGASRTRAPGVAALVTVGAALAAAVALLLI